MSGMALNPDMDGLPAQVRDVPKGDIAGPDTRPADCGDNNFTAVAQIWYRFHGVRKNPAMCKKIERR